MTVPKAVRKSSVLTWSIGLGVVFVVTSVAAVSTMGTKSNGQFKMVTPTAAPSAEPAPPPRPAPSDGDAAPPTAPGSN